jgi:adenine-specific DNA-methyltransferase
MPTLNWLTREQDLKAAANAEYRLLVEDETHGYGDPDTGNIIVQGDNLEALKALLPFYAGQVKCIYIDPPYNTGSAFEHYDDNMEHTIWLSMMYPRLKLLKQFLREDGSIWISIDETEGHYLKVICDEVFGRNNFITSVSWHRNYASANDAKTFAKVIDYILVYQRSGLFKRNLLPRTDKQNILYKYDSNDGKGHWRSDNLSVKTYSANYDYPIVNPHTGISYNPPKGRCWMTNIETVHKWIKEGRIFFGQKSNGAPQLKRYLNEVQEGIVPITYWSYDEAGHNDESRKELKALFPEATTTSLFSTPKPERLLQRILTLATAPGDYVLDSFLGSGTTAAVAHKIGRRYIGVEMGEQAKTHCAARLKKVIDGEQGGISKTVEWNGGGGFRFFTLGEAVFDNERRIKPDISFEHLAAHIFFTETKTPIKKQKKNSTFLGIHEETAYALLYNGILGDKNVNGGNVLTHATLNHIKRDIDTAAKKKGAELEYNQMVIYGEATRLTHVSLEFNNIIFKQTPYDIKVW